MDRVRRQKLSPLVRGRSVSEVHRTKDLVGTKATSESLAAVPLRTGLWRFALGGNVEVAVARARFAFLGVFGTPRGFVSQTACDEHPVAGF